MTKTPIEWADWSSNPLRYRTADGRVVWACEKISLGCQHCYAEALSHRYGGVRRAGEWNAATMGSLTPFLDDAELRRMLQDKRISGKRVFIGDMTDVFGAWVPDALLDRLFAVLALRPDVTWQILTKRASRAREYFNAEGVLSRVAEQAATIFRTWSIGRLDYFKVYPLGPAGEFGTRWFVFPFPLPNVWLGVSAENQEQADARIPFLLQTPAAVRFVSVEPLIGPVDLERYLERTDEVPCCGLGGCEHCAGTGTAARSLLQWVIVGGESGHGARPCDVRWIEAVVDGCRQAGTAVFVKQLGTRVVHSAPVLSDWPDDLRWEMDADGGKGRAIGFSHKAANPTEWPAGLRVREFPR